MGYQGVDIPGTYRVRNHRTVYVPGYIPAGITSQVDRPKPRRTLLSNRQPHRTIRVSDDLWTRAQESCEWRGDDNLSVVIRRSLTAYVRATDKKRREAEAATQAEE